MSVSLKGSAIISSTWTKFKTVVLNKSLLMQYDEEQDIYTLFAFDGPISYICQIWKNAVPSGVISTGYSQNQNNLDKADFESNYKSICNQPVTDTDYIRRKMVEVNFRKENILNNTYYVLVDINNSHGRYKHTPTSNNLLKIAGIHGIIIKSLATDQWVTSVGTVLSINNTSATIGWIRFGTQNVRDTGIFQSEVALTIFPFLSNLTVANGSYTQIANNYNETVNDLNSLVSIEDISGNSTVPEVGDFILRTQKVVGSGSLLVHYHLWYLVE